MEDIQPLSVDVEKITLITKDGERIMVDETILKRSAFFNTLKERNPEVEEVNLDTINASTMRRVVDWMEHYRSTDPVPPEQPLKSTNMADAVNDPWDASFVDNIKDANDLVDLIMAANFLDIQPLLYLSCAKIASFIKGKRIEEIPKVFEELGIRAPSEDNMDVDEEKTQN